MEDFNVSATELRTQRVVLYSRKAPVIGGDITSGYSLSWACGVNNLLYSTLNGPTWGFGNRLLVKLCSLLNVHMLMLDLSVKKIRKYIFVAKLNFWGEISMFSDHLILCKRFRFSWILCERSKLLFTWMIVWFVHDNIIYPFWCLVVAQIMSPTHCDITMAVTVMSWDSDMEHLTSCDESTSTSTTFTWKK